MAAVIKTKALKINIFVRVICTLFMCILGRSPECVAAGNTSRIYETLDRIIPAFTHLDGKHFQGLLHNFLAEYFVTRN